MAKRKPKRPKSPKRSSGLQVWLNYEKRFNAWLAKCRQVDSDRKRKASIIDKMQKRRLAA